MDLKRYFYRLTPPERDTFARCAGTTVRYIQCHLLTQRKLRRPALMRKLVSASGNAVTLDDLPRALLQDAARRLRAGSQASDLGMATQVTVASTNGGVSTTTPAAEKVQEGWADPQAQ